MSAPLRAFVILSAIAGCSRDPDCTEALRPAGHFLSTNEIRAATMLCTESPFAVPTRRCLATASSAADLERCAASEASVKQASERVQAASKGAAAWTQVKQAELDKMVADQEDLVKQLEHAYDAKVDAKTTAESAERDTTFQSLREQRRSLDAPIAAARTAQAAAKEAGDQRAKECAANPFATGCHEGSGS